MYFSNRGPHCTGKTGGNGKKIPVRVNTDNFAKTHGEHREFHDSKDQRYCNICSEISLKNGLCLPNQFWEDSRSDREDTGNLSRDPVPYSHVEHVHKKKSGKGKIGENVFLDQNVMETIFYLSLATEVSSHNVNPVHTLHGIYSPRLDVRNALHGCNIKLNMLNISLMIL